MSATGHRRRRASAAALALLAACGSGSGKDADGDANGGGSDDGGPGLDGGSEEETARCVEASGTRLKTVVLDHGGDDADLVRFLDGEFGDTECQFRTAADGTLRCLPLQTSTAIFTGAIRVWTDAACSNAIGEVSYEGTPASFVVFDFPSYSVCGSSNGTRYHQAGSRLPYDGTQTVYEKDQAGACIARTAYFNRSYYTLGPEIPATSFTFGLETWSTAGRMQIRSIEGEDGSRSCDHQSFRDHERDEACAIGVAEDGSQRCRPYAGFRGTLYTDASCSLGFMAAAQQTACAASNPRYLLGEAPACGLGRPLYQRGPTTTGSFYYMGTTCTPLGAGYDVFTVGSHVPPTELAEITEERHPVGGRLERVDLVGDGARIHKDLWFDPELDSACWFRRSGADDAWRCVPVSRPGRPIASRGSVRNGFSDAACTAAVQAVAEDCSGVAPGYVVDSGDDQRVYPVGAKLAQFYQSAGTCVPIDGTWYQTGAALPFENLVPATETPR